MPAPFPSLPLSRSLQQTASTLRSVHLLRALLREASYLPDADARSYFRRYIVNRFRAYQPVRNASSSKDAQAVEKHRHGFGKRRHISIINERTRAMQRKAQKGLNYLRLANLGDHRCLHKILCFTYGRMGTRKYALLERLLQPDDPAAAADPSPLQQLYYSNERCLSFFDAPKPTSAAVYSIDISDRYSRLKAVLKSQVRHGIALGREIKRPSFRTPINNVWERPMPIRRARGNVRRWYAETMTRLLPPLPVAEFDSMQAMANGTKRLSFAKRRSPAAELHPAEKSKGEQFTKLVQEALTLDKRSRVDKVAHVHRPHNLTVRFMKRLYARVLAYCCKLEWNDKFGKWDAVWGSGLRQLQPPVYRAPVDDVLFAGVDTKGRMLVEKQSKPREPRPEKSKPTEEQKPTEKRKKRKYTVIPFFVDYLPPDHPVRKEADAFRHEMNRAQSP